MTAVIKLVNGKIPANVVCPYKQQCDPQGTFCVHQGVNHSVPYSCGFACAHEILQK